AGSTCTDIAIPCTLAAALDSANANDDLSLARGSYDLMQKALPAFALHWVATDPSSRPVITSADKAATLILAAGQSGTSFDTSETDTPSPPGEMFTPAPLGVGPNVEVAIRSSVLSGPTCLDAPESAVFDIEDSKLTTTGFDCATLGPQSKVL